MEQTNQPIETRELRGITPKLLWGGLVGVIMIVVTIFGTYTALKDQIHEGQMQRDSDNKLTELRIKIIEQKTDLNSIQIKELTDKVNASAVQVKSIP